MDIDHIRVGEVLTLAQLVALREAGIEFELLDVLELTPMMRVEEIDGDVIRLESVLPEELD